MTASPDLIAIEQDEQDFRDAADRRALALTTLNRLSDAAVDAVVATPALRMMALSSDIIGSVPTPDKVTLTATTAQGPVTLRLLPGAHEQIAERVGIPRQYYDRMLETQPSLLAANVNRWLHAEPAKRLVRLLKPITDEDGQRNATAGATYAARAFLSDSYRPLDHVGFVNAILPAADEAGAVIRSFDLSDRRFHMKLVMGSVDSRDYLPAGSPRLGEIIRAGVHIRNSETGHAAIEVAPYVEVLRCLNGMVVNTATRRAHLGAKQGSGSEGFEVLNLSDETRRLEDAAIFLRLADAARNALSEVTLRLAGQTIAEAMGATIEYPAELPLMEFVTNIGRRLDLTDRENEILRDEVGNERVASARLGYLVPEGKLTRWTVTQALTATARVLGDAGDVDRRDELEHQSWRFLTDSTTALAREAQRTTRSRGGRN